MTFTARLLWVPEIDMSCTFLRSRTFYCKCAGNETPCLVNWRLHLVNQTSYLLNQTSYLMNRTL